MDKKEYAHRLFMALMRKTSKEDIDHLITILDSQARNLVHHGNKSLKDALKDVNKRFR